MESPLLTKSEHDIDVTVNSETLIPNEEHVVDMVGEDGYSSSTSEQTPHESEGLQAFNPCTEDLFWDLFEFVVTLVQIFAAIVVLILTKDEQKPELHLYPWIIGYICASFATVPVLCWRFWQHSPWIGSETRINEVMENLEKMLEYFFLSWVMIFLWSFLGEPSCLDNTTPHFWLWMTLLTFSCIRYVLPYLACAVLCFSTPVNLFLIKTKELLEFIFQAIVAAFLCVCGILLCFVGCIGWIAQCLCS